MSKYVVVCGSLNMDLVCTSPRIPVPGETILGYKFITKEGGKGANQAVALARMGMPTAMIGCVGNDSFGQALVDSLEKNGVDTNNIVRADCPTGTAHITVEDSGENSIVVIPSANSRVSSDLVQTCCELISGACAALIQLEIPLEAVREFLKLAKQSGAMTILNPAPMPAVGISEDILALVDMITPNEIEMESLSGIPVRDQDSFESAAQTLHAKGISRVICTMGAKGAFYSDENGVLHQGAQRVTAVDTTCAGDSFTGALVAKLCGDGAPVAEALEFASRVAALTVGIMGAQESLPFRVDVEG